jgi:hypothetical protein
LQLVDVISYPPLHTHTHTHTHTLKAAPGFCQCCELIACCQDTCEGCMPLTESKVHNYTKAVNAVGGVVTIDL